MKPRTIAALISVIAIAPPTAAAPSSDCTLNGFRLYGDVAVVDSFPDLKVEVVSSFPDLRVEVVGAFPDACGKWRFVESFPDLKIQYVDSFPDLKVQWVDSFPGLP